MSAIMDSYRSKSQQKLVFKDGKLSISASPSMPESPAAPPPKAMVGKRLRQEELARLRAEFGSIIYGGQI
jgi:hypothetical protein